MKRILTVEGDSGETLPYFEALQKQGVEAIFGDCLDGFSGLLLMGGTDVSPSLYGEARHPETEDSDDTRDRLECALIATALERDLPVLAICRGMQILNVQHGGTLTQHLQPGARHLQRGDDKSLNAHNITVVPGSRLAEILRASHGEVNSRHHQAVARVGAGLMVSARDAEDGVVEALERPDRRFVVGVQWHPENQLAGDESIAGRLFAAFAIAL